jgi:sodium-coupled neutral amino acid transporter 11
MLVILFTVVTQGFSVPPESRGTFDTSLLTINGGVFQAIGVISFGM